MNARVHTFCAVRNALAVIVSILSLYLSPFLLLLDELKEQQCPSRPFHLYKWYLFQLYAPRFLHGFAAKKSNKVKRSVWLLLFSPMENSIQSSMERAGTEKMGPLWAHHIHRNGATCVRVKHMCYDSVRPAFDSVRTDLDWPTKCFIFLISKFITALENEWGNYYKNVASKRINRCGKVTSGRSHYWNVRHRKNSNCGHIFTLNLGNLCVS